MNRSFELVVVCFASLFLIFAISGCREELKTGYGRSSGSEYSASVNGTIVLHEMIEATGQGVDRYSKFSPRWEKYQTIYWIPDAFSPPDKEVIKKIESWLAADRYRTLVLVGRDFDATMLYWELLQKNQTGLPSNEKWDREFVNATTNYLTHKHYGQFDECDWYTIADHAYTKAEKFSGELIEGIETTQLDIRFGTLPAPGKVTKTGTFGEYDAEVLMSVDSHPFIYSLNHRRFKNSQIIIVGNASFLLNLPLANEANRQLTHHLILKASENDYGNNDVLFIESFDKLPISQRDSPDLHSSWAWTTKKPLRYIVPYILFCCLLFCFVYFPIFGRPKKIKRRSTSNFRDHVDALGKLIHQTGSKEIPKTWIEEYRKRVSKHRSSRKDEN